MKKQVAMITAIAQVLLMLISNVPVNASEETIDNNGALYTDSNVIDNGVNYLKNMQLYTGEWYDTNDVYAASIINSLEYIIKNSEEYDKDICIDVLIGAAADYQFMKGNDNIDCTSNYLIVDELKEKSICDKLLFSQNPDGGFGLAKDYTSDIIDTKLALKALEDCGETESMSKAAMYIASLQNTDGGFGYQTGLDSDPLLSAEIADTLIDCANDDPMLNFALGKTIACLDTYLETTAIDIEDLSADNMDGVYQNFHTALFKLKKNNRYDVSPYYALQAEDGGVFEDPYASAMYLELIVREQNALVAGIDAIDITNDNGYAIAAYNSDENVNISIINNFETDKAFFKAQIIAPDGTSIPLAGDKAVWNTSDNADGEYTVRAEIIRKSNNEATVKSERTFNIRHRMNIDNVSLVLSQSYSRKGDDDTVSVNAEIGLQNFDESKNVGVHWTVETDGTVVSDNTNLITAEDIAHETIALGDFKPDTSARRFYIIKAEILSDNLQIAQSTTNYFVSDKSVALTYDTDKAFLYETEDDANVTINLRDERVVDLILTSSSDDTELLKNYADKVESIKARLEKLGYIVNLCSIETSYLSAKDTFAWNEYDHPNYNTQSPYTKHIVYENDNIRMLGYTKVPYKDFLFVPDNNKSQKIFNFDIQRDTTDWHSMNGGGFLFNTEVTKDTISGYYILITRYGLRLFELDNVNLASFRDTGNAGKLVNTFAFDDVYAEHHITIIANPNTLSVFDGKKNVIDNYSLENLYGNGYGPITSHASHNCSQRSFFTFANITMQTIKGEKLSDILDKYNFESDDSRYVINLSDEKNEDFQFEEDAQKIIDKNITFIGLGNNDSITQYQKMEEFAPKNITSHNYSDISIMRTVSDNIVNAEEAKRIKQEDSVISTDLHITGILSDGTLVVKDFNSLCEGETLSFDVPVSLDNLTAGIDAVLIKNVTLDYKDESGNARTKNAGDITLPVITPDGKIIGSVSTDKEEYKPYENVRIFDRIKNISAVRTAKGLKNVITVTDQTGNTAAVFTKELPEIMTSDYTEVIQNFNTADNVAGKYNVKSEVFDGDTVVASSSSSFVLNVPENPEIELSGAIDIQNMLFKTDDNIPVNYAVKNTGHYDLTDGTLSIIIADTSKNEPVYKYTSPLDLISGEEANGTVNVVPGEDFSSRKSNEYIVIYEAVTSEGQVIPLSGDGFMLDVMDLSMLGDDLLFAMDSENATNGINMSGWKMLINGSIHSNSSITGNCSIFDVSNGCTSLLEPVFNTWQTNLGEQAQITEAIELPDIMKVLRRRLLYAPVNVIGGEVVEDENNLRIYGNSSTIDTDIYSEKAITIIDPENFKSDTEEGVLICSEGDITIKTTNADFKGIIYAPNGTVRIESNNFNLQGRVIAKNIVFQGSVFTGETYEGDLQLFN